jgi:hypothetical protein
MEPTEEFYSNYANFWKRRAVGLRAAGVLKFPVLLHKEYTRPARAPGPGKLAADISALLRFRLLARFLHKQHNRQKRHFPEKKLDKTRVRMI